MNTSTSTRTKVTGLIGIVALLCLALASWAYAGPMQGKHDPLTRMLDAIDLTEQQSMEADRILDDLAKQDGAKRGDTMRRMLALNPDDPDYTETANRFALEAGDRLAQHIKSMAQARKDIYALLTPEQKSSLDRMIKRKLTRMENKHAARDH